MDVIFDEPASDVLSDSSGQLYVAATGALYVGDVGNWEAVSKEDGLTDPTDSGDPWEDYCGLMSLFIDHDGDPAILSWPQRRGRHRRHILWLREREFAVVLEERPRCWWLWTAYPTDRRHTQEKLMREYEAWKNADAAP
jgi:hypothetical protein